MTELLAKITLERIVEAYCIEHNLPIKRRFTHDELQEAVQAVRDAHQRLYGQPVAAESCTSVDEASYPRTRFGT